MNKKIILIISCILAVNIKAIAAFSSEDIGTAGAQFLKISGAAKAAAMGEAAAAVCEGADTLYWNPACLARININEVSFTHAVWLEDITFEHFAVSYKKGKHNFGLGVDYLSSGDIDQYNNKGINLDKTYKDTDMAVSLAYSRIIKDIATGISLKYISSKLEDESASAFAFDIGFHKYFMNERIAMGLAGQNIGTKLKYVDEEEILPMNLKLGAVYEIIPSGNFILALDINAPIDNKINVNTGLQYSYSLKENILILPRIGYKTNVKGAGSLGGISAGTGIQLNKYSFNYAWVPYGDLGQTHRISLAIGF